MCNPFRIDLSALAFIVCFSAAISTSDVTASEEKSSGRILSAIVSVRAEIAADARTIESLGAVRSGSGIVIDSHGLVVTVGYIIVEAERAFIALGAGDGAKIPARVLAYDHDTGLGILRSEVALDVDPMPLGDSSMLRPGSPVIVASFGGEHAARAALVVDRRAYAGYWEYLLEDAVFTSPPHPLFGGAALVSPSGELLGIGSLIVADAAGPGDPVPGNVFIPVNLLKDTLGALLSPTGNGGDARPWLGIYTRELDGALVVVRLAVDSPGLRAGVRPGERLQAVNGRRVVSMEGFYRALWHQSKAGDRITLTVLGLDGALRDVHVNSIDRHQWLRLKQVN